ncbi:MAG TPA: sugar-binding protein [Capsulimonadaceae bacterium]|jgi:hypothetical protein
MIRDRFRSLLPLLHAPITAAAALVLCTPIAAHADYAGWKASSTALAKDPSLVRYYKFEEKSGFTVANSAPGGDGAWTMLSNSPYGESREERWWVWNSPLYQTFPEWSQGRWPEKGAMTSGKAGINAVRSKFSGTKDGIFTVSAWVRVQGGDQVVDEGTDLFKVGDAYGAGWRLCYSRAKWATRGLIEFRFGTPKGPVTVTAQPFDPQVWHHLVAEWDGKALKLFVDGAFIAEKACLGPYTDIARIPAWCSNMAEMDTGGLDFGRPGNGPRFDVDELAIFDRALPAAEVAAQYQAGQLEADVVAQKATYVKAEAQAKSLTAIKMSIPDGTIGIFHRGTPIPATVVIPAAAGLQGAYTAHYKLCDQNDAVVVSETRKLAANTKTDVQSVVSLAPAKCGIYFLDMWITDSANKVVKRIPQEYGIAVIVPIPAAKDVPLSSPLQAHNISGNFFENAFLGYGVDRWIKSNEIYKKPGEFNEAFFKPEFDYEQKMGLKVFFCLHLWAPGEKVPGKKWLMKDMSPWADYCRQMVRHYKDKVAYWEIENEPNAGDLIAADEYVEFLKVGYEAIKAEDPKAVVVGLCGCPGFVAWNEKVFEAGGAKYFDVMSLHNYNAYPIRSTVRERLVEKAIATMVKYRGERVPVWNSETGFHPVARNGSRPLTEAEMSKLYPRTEKVLGQPAYLPADMPVLTEHYTACWQTQSVLLDLAAGCEKFFILSGASHYHPNFNFCDGQPTELAPAIAALQSVLIPSEKVSKISLMSSSDAGAMILQKGGRRIAALFSDETPTREFRVNRAGIFNGMDMLGNPLQWTANADHIIRVKLGSEPLYIFDVPADFAAINYLAMTTSSEKLPANGVMNGVVTVTNPSAKPLSATLTTIPPKGATITVESKISLAPHETRKLLFRLDGQELRRRPYEMSFVLSEGKTELSKLSTMFLSDGTMRPVVQLNAPAALGDGKWWQGVAPERCIDVDNVVKGTPIVGVPWAPQWRGAKDQSFELRSAWQKDGGLFIRIDVTDDVVMPAPADKRGLCFQYDCIELFVDGRKPWDRKEQYSPGVEQMLIIPNGQTTAAPCDFWFAGKKPTLKAEFVGARTATGYWVEGHLSPDAGTAFTATAGTEYALDVLIDDTDTESALRKGAMALHGVFNNSTDPTKWGRYELSDIKR